MKRAVDLTKERENQTPRLVLAETLLHLGRATEAEDVLQDAYLRFLGAPLAGIESPKAYLLTIVTRLCLNQLTSARAQRETYVGPWLPEPVLDTDFLPEDEP